MLMFECKYCGMIRKNANSLRNHERLCKLNPNHQSTPFQYNNPQKVCPWNKGKTKYNDIRIAHIGEGYHKSYIEGNIICHQKGKPRTQEERKRISATMKANKKSGGYRLGSGRGKKGWYNGYYCDSTYELVYVIYNLDHQIKFQRCTRKYPYIYNGVEHNYYPDFELFNGELVEIKGYCTEQTQEKILAVSDKKITILTKEKLKYAFDYVKKTYHYHKIEELYNGVKQKMESWPSSV